MRTGYLAKAGTLRVEHHPCPYPGADVDQSAPPTGVLHTTEGSFEGSLGVFERHYAPHFMVGRDSNRHVRILQLVPLGKMATALEHPPGYPETNRVCRVQIEVVAFSKTELYSFDPELSRAVAALLAQLNLDAQIPLARAFPDQMPPPPWATRSFARRRAGKFGRVAGWYGHVEVPGNSHWDPGALKWSDLLAQARTQLPPAPRPDKLPGPSPKPAWFWEWADWKRMGGQLLRPESAPRMIPPWAWLALREFNKRFPVK